MAAKHIDETQLHELIESGKTFLIDFWAPWCGDCIYQGDGSSDISTPAE